MTAAAGRLARTWRAWVALTDRREPATALALVRIGVAFVLACEYVMIWQRGLIDPLWSRFPAGYATAFTGWSHELGIGAHGLWALALGSLVLICIGLVARPACIVFVLVSAQQSAIAPNSESGFDMLMRVAFVILALSRCNAKWSVDAWLRARIGRPMPSLVPAWPRLLLCAQLVWVYFSGGHNKSSAAWGPHGGFTALANVMMEPHYGRLDPDLVVAVYPLTRVATALTMVFELTAVLYLVWLYYAATADRPGRLRRIANRLHLRWIWLGLGVAFELGIAVTMRLGAFPFGMLSLFWVLLLPEDLTRLGRLGGRLRGQRRNADVPANRASSPS